jgi:Zn-finger nucleic acid-binding protein
MCNIPLMMADRQGVEINYCPTCRGVWIDRGGLDRIIDRSSAPASRPPDTEKGHREYEHDRYRNSEGHRKKSFFSDLFD